MSLSSQRAILLRGDPGLFDILKKVGKAALGFVPGGSVVQTGLGLVGGGPGRGGPRFPIALPGRPFAGQMRPGPPTGVGFTPVPGDRIGLAMGCPKGWHPNRSSYHTSQGFVAQGTRCVRNRRRNLSNGRANSRALRRMAAWEKQDKKRRQVLKKIATSAG